MREVHTAQLKSNLYRVSEIKCSGTSEYLIKKPDFLILFDPNLG